MRRAGRAIAMDKYTRYKSLIGARVDHPRRGSGVTMEPEPPPTL